MGSSGSDSAVRGAPEQPMTMDQLRAYEQGWGVRIMPIRVGWKVHYFSTPDFENEPGSPFASFEDAIEAVCAVLPAANSEEQRAQARADLRRLPSDGGTASS